MSADCLDMLTRLLVAEPSARMSMGEIKVHRWFQRGLPPGALEMNDFLLQSLTDMDEVLTPGTPGPLLAMAFAYHGTPLVYGGGWVQSRPAPTR